MIDVLLVNEQRLFSEAIQALLSTENDINVIGIAASKEEAIKHITRNQPDVVLMDIEMPTFDGIKVTIEIKENDPTTKVILLTSYAKEDLIIAGIIAGADGYLLKSLDADNLIQSIRNAYNGQIVLSGEAAKILAKEIVEMRYDKKTLLDKKLINRNIHLTGRELDVAHLIMERTTNRDMAKELHLSEGTVKNYIGGLYSKLDLPKRKEVIAYLRSLFTGYYL